MKYKLFLSKPRLGLDIQPHTIKFIQLRRARNTYLLDLMLAQSLPAGMIKDGKVQDRDGLIALISEMVRLHQLTGVATTLALPAHLVRVQKLSNIAGLTPKEIQAEIYLQVRRDLPGLQESLCIDYDKEFFAVTRQEHVSQYADCLHSAGLKLTTMDVDSYVLRNLFARYFVNPREINAVCYIADYYAQLIIFSSTEIIFQHVWNLQAQEIVWQELQSKLHLFAVMHPKLTIQQLIYTASEMIPAEIELPCVLHSVYVNPFADFRVAKSIAQESLLNQSQSFLLAAACALREGLA